MKERSWIPTPTPKKKQTISTSAAKSRRQQMDEFLRWMRAGYNAYEALERVGRKRQWLWRMRRYDPVFSDIVMTYDRIARDQRIGDPGAMKPDLLPAKRIQNHGLHRRARQKMEREAVELREKEAFLAIYRETGSRTAALDKLGLKAKEVERELEEDSEFAAAMDEENLRRLWSVQDAQWDRAKEKGVDARFLIQKMEKDKKIPGRKKQPDPTKQLPSWGDEEKAKAAKGWVSGEVGFHSAAPSEEKPS